MNPISKSRKIGNAGVRMLRFRHLYALSGVFPGFAFPGERICAVIDLEFTSIFNIVYDPDNFPTEDE